MIGIHDSHRQLGPAVLIALLVLGWLVVQNTLLLIDPAALASAPFVVARALLRAATAIALRYPLLFVILAANSILAVWIAAASWRAAAASREETLS